MIRVVPIIAIPNSQNSKIKSTVRALCIRIKERLVPEPVMAPVDQTLAAFLVRSIICRGPCVALLGFVKLRVQLHRRC